MAHITDENRIIVSGAGCVARPGRGWLRFDGRDVLAFLQALVSNDVAVLPPDGGRYATYLTPQGRMITDLEIHAIGEAVLAAVPRPVAHALRDRFESLIFSEDVAVRDISDDMSEVVVTGNRAPEILAAAFERDSETFRVLPELGRVAIGSGPDARPLVVRGGDASLPIFTILTAPANVGEIVEEIISAGAVPVSIGLLNGLRLEAGRPTFGVDMNEDTIPLEAGLLARGISTSKGCYVGQEIIIRMLHRGGGRVARRLAVFDVEGTQAASPGALRAGDRPAGHLTSVGESPETGRPIALGYVSRDFAAVGAELAREEGGIARVKRFVE
jgi:folate-binding protein YgfZ